MKFDKDFNPGTGNTYVLLDSGAIYNNNPNATTVTNTTNIYMDGKKSSPMPENDSEKQIRKNAILDYVGKLKDYAKNEWKGKYDRLWLEILAIPTVDAEIYNKGQQKDTIFNRNLVGNIIHVLIGKVIDETNVTTLTKALEDKPGASVRGQMGIEPSADIVKPILELITKQYVSE